MLKPETIAVIKQTVPILQAHGEDLTRHFYARMFRENPEVKAFFNPAHQQSGAQQRALAGAICAYAQHVDNPAVLTDAVELIAQKHVSLGIRPEHYPIVGENLLASIREVLGEAATDEIIDAWAEAYGALADIFIQREKELFTGQEATHGWQGFKPFLLEKRERCSDNIESFYLCPGDGAELAPHQPGQYITLRITLPDGSTTMRNYSLSSAPGEPWFRISVKRETGSAAGIPDGVVSGYLHNQLRVGDSLEVAPPGGEFILTQQDDSKQPLVFIAGGVGITPLMSMIQVALEESPDRPVMFIQCALNGQVQPFADELANLQQRYDNLNVHVRFSAPNTEDLASGRCDSEGVVDDALLDELVGGTTAAWYVCGPTPMLLHMSGLLKSRGVADEDFHYEFFGPAEALRDNAEFYP